MSQFDFGTIDPTTKSGTQLASDLNAWRTALHSSHKGPNQPTYRIAGMTWIDDNVTPWLVKTYDGADWCLTGSIDPTNNMFYPYHAMRIGANTPAANNLPLGSEGNYFTITGSTQINTIATKGIGTIIELYFTGTPLIQHSADISFPFGFNYQVAAGDTIRLIEYAAGDWRVLNINRAVNTWEAVETKVISSSTATADFFNLGSYSILRLSGRAVPVTDAVRLIARTSTDNTNFDAGAADYAWQIDYGNASTPQSARSVGDTGYSLSTGTVGNLANEGNSFELLITEFNAAQQCQLSCRFSNADDSGLYYSGTSAGRRISATARNALQVRFTSGNIARMVAHLEGIRG